MKNLPLAIRIIINFVFYFIYSLILIFIVNFTYGFILYVFDKSIPGSDNPVHLKMALIVLLFVFIFSLVFRKYFYISIFDIKDIDIKISNYTKKEEVKKEEVKKEEQKVVLKEDIDENELEIFIGREKNK